MRRVIRKQIRTDKNGLHIAADLSAVIAVNHGEPGQTNRVKGESHARAEQHPQRHEPDRETEPAEADTSDPKEST